MITDVFRQEVAKDRKVVERTKEIEEKISEATEAMLWIQEHGGVDLRQEAGDFVVGLREMRSRLRRTDDFARGHIDALEWGMKTLQANGYE